MCRLAICAPPRFVKISFAMLPIIAALAAGQNVGGKLAAERQVPHGLSASDWSGIREAYEAGRHVAVACDGGYQARNPGQQWRTRFDGKGFLVTPDDGGWSWGLELVSYGRDGDERAFESPGCIDAEGQRVEYEWDDTLTEWYVNDPRGLEHGYTIRRRPDAGTLDTAWWRQGQVDSRCGGCETPDTIRLRPGQAGFSHPQGLNITLAVRGGLRLEVRGDGQDVAFVDAAGAAVLTYRGLKVFDADGRSLPARFESSRDALRLTIDDAGARYPLTVDPIAQQAYLKASNTGPSDQLGYSVAVSGDTVVVGAFGEDSVATGVNGDQSNNNALSAGAAYVFVRNGSTWSQQAYLKASNTGASDLFGYSVAVSGDTVVVGAIMEDSSATGVDGDEVDNGAMESGAAYVFVRSGTSWTQQAYLKASNTGAGDWFGWSVAISGDTVVVGALREDSSATGVNGDQSNNNTLDSGAAYVFLRSGTTWSQQAYLKASNTDVHDEFSYSVTVSGDTVVVGASDEDSAATGVNGNQTNNNAQSAGAAFVFVRSGSTWSQQAYLKASNTGAGDFFGISVTLSGDTLAIGAFMEDSSATGVNGNQSDNNAVDSGAAYVFTRNGTSWGQQAYLKASNTGADDQLGWSVAGSGDTVVVGAFMEDSSATGVNGDESNNGAVDSGAVYVFTRSGTMWSQQAYLKASNTGAGDHFGESVAVSGGTAMVGARFEDSNATGVDGNQASNSAGNSGAAYAFTGVGRLLGDCDGDGDVDLANFAAFAACATGPVAELPEPSCDCFDVNSDDAVDLLDFADIQIAFTG